MNSSDRGGKRHEAQQQERQSMQAPKKRFKISHPSPKTVTIKPPERKAWDYGPILDREAGKKVPLFYLPAELWSIILSYLPAKDMLEVSRTTSLWRDMALSQLTHFKLNPNTKEPFPSIMNFLTENCPKLHCLDLTELKSLEHKHIKLITSAPWLLIELKLNLYNMSKIKDSSISKLPVNLRSLELAFFGPTLSPQTLGTHVCFFVSVS